MYVLICLQKKTPQHNQIDPQGAFCPEINILLTSVWFEVIFLLGGVLDLQEIQSPDKISLILLSSS